MKAALISFGSVSSKWIGEAMKKYFAHVDELDIRQIEVNLTQKGAKVLHAGNPIGNYDCVYAKGSYRYSPLLRSLATELYPLTYMPVKPPAFTLGQDKLLTQLKLQQCKIPMPVTYLAATTESAKEILRKINYPIIIKFPSGMQGKGVMFAESYAAASSLLDALTTLRQPFLIQEYIETEGVDTRAIVVGDTVVAAMKRKAMTGEKRANIHAGGEGIATELDQQTKAIAIRAAEAIGAEICGVDIIEGDKGPLVLEVNLSPGLQGITNTTKIDVADKIAQYLYQRSKQWRAGPAQGSNKIFQELGVESSSAAAMQEIITTLDMKANRLVIPQIVTQLCGISANEEVTITVRKGELHIKKFSVGKK